MCLLSPGGTARRFAPPAGYEVVMFCTVHANTA